MKTIRTCLALALTLLAVSASLLSCVDMAIDPPGATLSPEPVQTTAPVTTVDRDTLTIPDLTADEEALYRAIWAVYKDKEFQGSSIYPPKYEEFTINDIYIFHPIYRFDEALVSFFHGFKQRPIAPGDMITYETVEGYTFEYGSTTHFSVWANEKEYTLQEAYDAGVLTKEEIGQLWEMHYGNSTEEPESGNTDAEN